MSLLSTAVSSMGLDLGSNIYSARQAEENQRRDISSKERFAKNKYQWQMADMKKSGLNPILAAGSSPGSGGAGGSATGSPGGTNFHQSASARSLIKLDKKVRIAQEKQLDWSSFKDAQQGRLNAQYKQLIKANTDQAIASASMAKRQAAFYKKYPFLQHIEQSPNTLNSANNLLQLPANYLKAIKSFGKGTSNYTTNITNKIPRN